MNVLIVEDEQAALRRLKKLLSEATLSQELNILGELESIEQSLNWLSSHPAPDLIFMDIHLADGSCFDIFQHTEVKSPIIFTTAYDEYALQAFKVNAIDYLLKPIKKAELEAALSKYSDLSKTAQINYHKLSSLIETSQTSKRFMIRIGQQIRLVDINDVAFFYTENKITFLITRQGKRYPIDYFLDKIEEMADPQKFFRVNRQFIIHIDAIEEMHAYSKSRFKIILNPPAQQEVVVSAVRSPQFRKWLTGE
jgi:two-component system LytT family response regulator